MRERERREIIRTFLSDKCFNGKMLPTDLATLQKSWESIKLFPGFPFPFRRVKVQITTFERHAKFSILVKSRRREEGVYIPAAR